MIEGGNVVVCFTLRTCRAGGPMLRFVILEHDHPVLHWDLMLESGAALRTWRLAAPPGPGADFSAALSFDHRRLYLDYEGPVSGGRGRVVRWDGGTFTWGEEGEDRLVVRLSGGRLRGTLRLDRVAGEDWRGSFAAGAGA
jgi:hypothetical protein